MSPESFERADLVGTCQRLTIFRLCFLFPLKLILLIFQGKILRRDCPSRVENIQCLAYPSVSDVFIFFLNMRYND
jgi:hypothetical protein